MNLPKYPSFILFVAAFFCCGFAQAQNPYGFHAEVSGQGQPIIFIPGAISGGDTWKEIASDFSETHQTHVLTMPGYAGVPPQNEAPYLETWKSNIIRYIEDHNLENVTIVGHSIGGFLSLWTATEQIPHIQSVIVVDAMPFFQGAFNPAATAGFDEAAAKAYITSFSNFSDDEVLMHRKMVAQGMTKNESKIEMMMQWAQTSDLKTEAYSVMEMMGADIREDLSKIQVPVIVFAAYEENPQFPKEMLSQIYTSQYQHLDNYTFKIAENARHFIMFDQPEWLIQQMRTFLAEQMVSRH